MMWCFWLGMLFGWSSAQRATYTWRPFSGIFVHTQSGYVCLMQLSNNICPLNLYHFRNAPAILVAHSIYTFFAHQMMMRCTSSAIRMASNKFDLNKPHNPPPRIANAKQCPWSGVLCGCAALAECIPYGLEWNLIFQPIRTLDRRIISGIFWAVYIWGSIISQQADAVNYGLCSDGENGA